MFHFLIWQVITLLYSAKSQAIALHNVSYKGHAQLNNVTFMGHYDMTLHIMMELVYILYVIAYVRMSLTQVL